MGKESAPEEKSAGQGMALLRDARLARGLSVQEVARQLRLSIRQVTALEEDDYSKLSSGTFLRGFVRNYAKLLQVDPRRHPCCANRAIDCPRRKLRRYRIKLREYRFPQGGARESARSS